MIEELLVSDAGDKAKVQDGLSSRFMHANRSRLLPSLQTFQKDSGDSGTDLLYGRLEEVLAFEILKDGGSKYMQVNIRNLYKYVVKAIRSSSSKKKTSTRELEGPLPVSPAVVGNIQSQFEPRTKPILKGDGGDEPESPKGDGRGHQSHVTWRERLGGFLHPRDMRKLFTPFSGSNEPELIVRRHAMLLNFDPLRAVILRDRAIVLVPDGADTLLVELEKRIRGGSSNNMVSESIPSSMIEKGGPLSLNKPGQTRPSELSHQDALNSIIEDRCDEDNDADGDSSLVDSEWADFDGREWIDLPFELQCVDAVLSSVSSILAEDIFELQLDANGVIDHLEGPHADTDDNKIQGTLRSIKGSLQVMTSRVQGFGRAINTVLEDYEDMALMNLSRLLTHPEKFVQPVPKAVLEEESDVPELILESHLQGGHTLANALTLVQVQINSTDDFASRQSDLTRNRLLYISMILNVFSLFSTWGGFVASIYGMNVINFREESESAFNVIVYGTLAGMVVAAVAVLELLRRIGVLPNYCQRKHKE